MNQKLSRLLIKTIKSFPAILVGGLGAYFLAFLSYKSISQKSVQFYNHLEFKWQEFRADGQVSNTENLTFKVVFFLFLICLFYVIHRTFKYWAMRWWLRWGKRTPKLNIRDITLPVESKEQLVDKYVSLLDNSFADNCKSKISEIIDGQILKITRVFDAWKNEGVYWPNIQLVDGNWGSGKSSLVNLALKEEGRNSAFKPIFINFSEYSETDQAISESVEAFFRTLRREWGIRIPTAVVRDLELNVGLSPSLKVPLTKHSPIGVNGDLLAYLEMCFKQYHKDKNEKVLFIFDEVERCNAAQFLRLLDLLNTLRKLSFVRIIVVASKKELVNRLDLEVGSANSLKLSIKVDKFGSGTGGADNRFDWDDYLSKYFIPESVVLCEVDVKSIIELARVMFSDFSVLDQAHAVVACLLLNKVPFSLGVDHDVVEKFTVLYENGEGPGNVRKNEFDNWVSSPTPGTFHTFIHKLYEVLMPLDIEQRKARLNELVSGMRNVGNWHSISNARVRGANLREIALTLSQLRSKISVPPFSEIVKLNDSITQENLAFLVYMHHIYLEMEIDRNSKQDQISAFSGLLNLFSSVQMTE